MEKDIKAIILLLATQAMINLGEIKDPLTQEEQINLDSAQIFIQLLEVLAEKTQGNLTDEEKKFFDEVRDNLAQVYKRKLN